MKLTRIGTLGAVMLASALALAIDDGASTLVRTQKAGDIVRYKVDAVANAGGAEVIVVRTLKHEIKEIRKNGEVVTEITDLGGTVNAMGQEMEYPLAGRLTMVADKLGRPVKYERGADGLSVMSPEAEQLLLVAQDFLLPEKPVKPADTWQYEIANPLLKDHKVTIKATFVGLEKLEETTVWKIKQTLTAPIDAEGDKMVAEMVFQADPATGLLVRSEGTIKSVPSQYGPVDLTWKAKLVKDEAEKAKPAT